MYDILLSACGMWSSILWATFETFPCVSAYSASTVAPLATSAYKIAMMVHVRTDALDAREITRQLAES